MDTQETRQAIQPTEKRFDIERGIQEKLKLYFLSVKPANVLPISGECIRGILAYRPEDAIAFQHRQPETGDRGIFWLGDFAYVEAILKMIQSGEGVAQVVQEPTIEQPADKIPTEEDKQIMAFESFKASLLMAIKEYAGVEDALELEGILGRLKAPTRPTGQRGGPDKGVNNEKQPA